MRSRRRLIRCLSVVLLFMQLAVAAYACPAAFAPTPAPMAEMPGCAGNMAGTMDPSQPLLCQAHCQQGSQTAQSAPALDATTSAVLWAVLDWAPSPRLPAQAAQQMYTLHVGASPPGSPPLYLRLLVLRN